MEGGINDALASMLGLLDVASFEGIGRVGTLPSPLSFEDFCERVKKALDLPTLHARRVTDTVYRVAVVGGEGKDLISAAVKTGADTYLSGRLGYHAMLDGEINLLEGGHYFTEKHAASLLAAMAKDIDPAVETQFYTPNLLSFY